MSTSLSTLVSGYGKALDGVRVYEVKVKGKPSTYVVSNSPGNAALEVCEVRRVTDKELVTAAFEAMGVKGSNILASSDNRGIIGPKRES